MDLNSNTDWLRRSYDDAFLSLVPGDQEFIGGKSIVVHFANKTRITCADLVLLGGNSTSTNSTSTNSKSSNSSGGKSLHAVY